MNDGRFYEAPIGSDARRSAPAALRNREPIADVLAGWLPANGVVLEVASGTGEHAVHFAARFPAVEWQPSDRDSDALASIQAWRGASGLPNLRPPVLLDASLADWPVGELDAILCCNMAHISPWGATLGVLDGAARHLRRDGRLIFYGPWLVAGIETASTNLAFDASLRARNPDWGLRDLGDLLLQATDRGLVFRDRVSMPANNLMILLERV